MGLLLQGPAPWSIVSTQAVRLEGRTPRHPRTTAVHIAHSSASALRRVFYPSAWANDGTVSQRTWCSRVGQGTMALHFALPSVPHAGTAASRPGPERTRKS